MRTLRTLCALVVLAPLLLAPTLHAQTAPDAIRQVMAASQEAWNRGDIVDFMHGYANSPDTTFIGTSIEHGYQMILARYKASYASPAAMGHLEFSGLDVRMLGADHAVVTGHFRLSRTSAGGGDAAGIFSLVFEKQSAGWKIILDHSSIS
ncbi:MAG TPA: SgcJ/EcaC family oxidoreductase [Acidobacteriaceae bacterium]|nr:SgcJ/EcaC family oxidoreductase [Acidobacteriaceae bacterium]